MTRTRIPVTFFNELKGGDVTRTVEEDGLWLVLLNDKPVGREAAIVNDKGKLYLVSEQVIYGNS